MTVKLAIGIAGIGLCLAGATVPLAAHHAFAAEFDANKPVEFTGVVTKMEWVNPHVWIASRREEARWQRRAVGVRGRNP